VAATIIAGVAILASILTFALTYLASLRAERRGRMPVLVLLPDKPGWRLENIGGGPALNIVIAQGRGPATKEGLIELRADDIGPGGIAPEESWCNPIHLRPMPAGGSQHVPWEFSTSGVGVSFTDALGSVYTLRTSSRGSLIMEKQGIPDWREGEWRQLSDIEGSALGGDVSHESRADWGIWPA
jgi:hypothetical protein